MTQRVDVHSDDGGVWLNQLVTNLYMRKKVWEKASAGRRVTISPSAPPPPPPPPGHPKAAQAQYKIFCDTNVLNTLAAPSYYVPVLSADVAFRSEATAANVAKLRQHFARVEAWCDCEFTLPPEAIALVKELGLDGWVGQCENPNQYNNATAQWGIAPNSMVGILGALDQWQVEAIRSYQAPPFICEDFWNEGGGRQPVEPAISAYCAGIYPTKLMPDPTVAGYKAAGRWRKGDGLFKNSTVRDWQNLP